MNAVKTGSTKIADFCFSKQHMNAPYLYIKLRYAQSFDDQGMLGKYSQKRLVLQ